MKLPDPILNDVLRYFEPHHPYWHLARVRTRPAGPAGQIWDEARATFPTLKFSDESGAGAEFLTFHRPMMREYRWILQQHPASGITYSPWSSIPQDVAEAIAEHGGPDLATGVARIAELVRDGSLDELGAFVEPTSPAAADPGAGLHASCHGAVGYLERDVTERRYSMSFPSTSHRNIVFYQLHGWIDEIYADWQRAHGEEPDLSPLQPGGHGGHGGHLFSKKLKADSLLSKKLKADSAPPDLSVLEIPEFEFSIG